MFLFYGVNNDPHQYLNVFYYASMIETTSIFEYTLIMQNASAKLETATFAAGCFWGVEETFRRLKGMKSTMVGYTGGHFENPSYQDVCSGRTAHAEAVQVEFDPNEIAYEDLLKTFFQNHNPTTRNQQGPDIGSQYRSAIFYHSPEQKKLAEAYKKALNEAEKYPKPIVTEIAPASTFYRAEEYHQKYLMKKGLDSCHI